MGNPGMCQRRPESFFAPMPSTSIYDTAPQRRTLAEMVDLDRLNNGGIWVAVGATNVGTSDIKYFDNDKKRLSFGDVVASGRLPPGFLTTEVDGDCNWDGGLFFNIALSPALNHLKKVDKDKRELIVIELFTRESPIPA